MAVQQYSNAAGVARGVSGCGGRPRRDRRPLAAAARAVVEALEGRALMAGDASIVQTLPYHLDFESAAGGVADKNGVGTGFSWVMPNKNGTEYAPSLVELVGGRLRVTTAGTSLAGGPWENDNTLVNGLQTQFNGTGSFSVTTRMVGPLGYLNKASEQGGLLFGPDQDNYVKLVAVAQPNGTFLQFVDEQKPAGAAAYTHAIASDKSYTNVGTFTTINTLDLTIAGDAATGVLTAYYRINGGALVQVTQTLTLAGAQKAKFFSQAARAGVIAMQKNDLAAETLVYESFGITPGTPTVSRPSVRADEVTPGPGSTDVQRDSFVSAALNLPNVGKGVDTATLNTSTVKLYRTSDRASVPGQVSTSGAGDTITFQPYGPFDASTGYTFEVTTGVKDTGGAAFAAFAMQFTTGTRITPTDPNLAFEKVSLATATGQQYSCVTVGPDGKLYASSLSGLIQRFTILPDGTLSAPQNITTVQTANGANRFISGITFDPASTADNLILWVNNGQYAFENASDWTGKLSRLSGPDLGTYQDFVTGLPRAIRDHLNNQIAFGPDGKLYFALGSNSSMGQADNAWGLRPERLLSAAVLQVDTAALSSRVAAGRGPLDSRTENNPTGNYNPWAADAPVKIYASGVRNAYDLVWTRSGFLYAPTNGSAAGGASPSVAAGTFPGTRVDTPANGPFTTPAVTGIPNIAVSEVDSLFKVEPGGYYGHPNPLRGEYVANGGNPTDAVDPLEFSQYAVGTQPDRNYRGAAYVFGKNHSPDGAIEYKGDAFGGRLDGKLLVTRYSGGGDIVALTLDAEGNVTEAKTGIAGLSGFANPLDLTQDPANGNLYIVDYGAQKIYLARPIAPGAKITVDTTTLRFSDDYASGNTATSPTRVVRITNTGTAPLTVPSTGLTLSNATNWVITSKPTLPATIGAGESVEVGVAFRATSATGAGVKTAALSIQSSDPSNPTVTVELRGLAAAGTGGQNEPSLQRILDLYGIGVKTGDANPANTNLLSNAEPQSATNDEVLAQRFVKAGTGPVTIEPLAAYAGGTPSLKFGYYAAGTADARTELLSVPATDAQTVNPAVAGTTSFDPGSSRFGLYAYFPIFTNYAYSEDSLNAKENTAPLRRKVRYFPLKDAAGATVPNAYIFTSEDYNNDPSGGTDANDFVAIVRNVVPSNDGAEVGLENTDGTPFPDRLVFSRVQNPVPDKKKDANGNLTIQPPNNVEHDTAVLRVRNTGSDPLVINSLAVSNASAWTIVDPPAAGTSVPAGGFLDVTVKFVAQVKPPYPGFNPTPDPTGFAANNSGFYNGTLTVGTSDADEPTTTVQLAGWWQAKSEDNQEPSLPVLATNLFGYTTKILNSGQSMFALDGSATTIGEEVVSRYWVRADASSPVTVKQLAAYHSQGDSALVRWAPFGSTTLAAVVAHAGTDGQSVLPHLANSSTALATGTFKPYTASANPLAAFQFKIDSEWSDDAMNKPVSGRPNDTGHHVRFFPARDQKGNLIPNTWMMGMDYLGINYDYQDNLYLVENMRPMPPATPAGLTAAGQPSGVSLNWTPTANAPLLAGYNVYRATSTSGPFAKLNAEPVTAASHLDATAASGVTYYYRVTAADSWGGESSTSSVVSAARTADNVPPAPPTALTAAGVGTGVSLSWAANGDADLSGYKLYRSAAADGTYTALNGGTLIAATTFADATASPGSTYYYKLTAVDFSGNESPASAVASAAAGDHVAPAAPTSTAAASADAGLSVTWIAPADADVAGYRVYRSAAADGSGAALASGTALVAGTTWTDSAAQVGETWYYLVTAVDASNNESTSSAAAGATRVAVARPTVRIDVGSAVAFTDALGQAWQADRYVTGGTASGTAYDVAGTTDDALYYTRRFGAFAYAIPVPNGQYTLNLHFADSLYTVGGKRVFDVKVEGATALAGFDIAGQGGGKTKLVKSIPVTITDGVLNLQTVIKTENPLLSGIELIPVAGPADPTDPGTGDTVPPAIPGSVAATPAAAATGGINVSWAAVNDADLAGYNVYRSTTSAGPWEKLTATPVAGTSYAHAAAPEGQAGYYYVTAVDATGNESAASAVAGATAPVVPAGTGLVGRYYAGKEFTTLKLTRTDGTVNFDWGSGSPNPAVPADNFSVRWTGAVKAAATGNHVFTVRASDGVRLWVNGQLVIDRWFNQNIVDQVSAPVALTAGQKVDVKLEYYDGTGAAAAKLYWAAPGLTKAIVPRGNLYVA